MTKQLTKADLSVCNVLLLRGKLIKTSHKDLCVCACDTLKEASLKSREEKLHLNISEAIGVFVLVLACCY